MYHAVPAGVGYCADYGDLDAGSAGPGIEPKVPEVALFNKVFLTDFNLFGRVYELGLMGSMNVLTSLASRQPKRLLSDMDLGLEMIKKTKISFLPTFSRSRPDKVKDVHPTEKQVGLLSGMFVALDGERV
jgi:hypothetical protein